MKRSKMLIILNDAIIESGICKDFFNDIKDLDYILSKLEEAGMLPPEYKSDIYIRSDCEFARINEWEEE